ncbi:phospholipid-binding lipoprotein [Escherichia coli]|nr:phospholipid-binding lipoprotein [Escherichia coli]
MADGLYPVLSWLTWPMSVGKWKLEGMENGAQVLDADGVLRPS